MTLLTNQILVMQSRLGGECSFLDSSIALLLCSDSPSLPLHGEYCSPSLGELQAREEALPAWCGYWW